LTTILERRRIEAEFAKPIYEALTRELGRPRARAILAGVIAELARQAGGGLAQADRDAGLTPSLPRLHELTELWKQGGALELDVIEVSEARLDFNVTRCRYAETYQELGVREIGDILSCERDGEFICGYLPKARLTRTQTIMKGAAYCDFRFSAGEPGAGEPGAGGPGAGGPGDGAEPNR
jgi:hypothetical protein